jgi:2-dehydropantoate 2-reductase
MHEVIRAAQALGFAVKDSLAEKQIANTRVMGAYKASTLIDYERGLPLELERMFLEPLRQARAAGVPTPRLAALCEVLKQTDPSRAHRSKLAQGRFPRQG